ncbi:MAG TPA: response regulator transcription factor [Bacillota bacterium]|nr:response regulator transcription factor [Bacillota bacterium]
MSIRVVIADDHAVVREGTRQILEQQPGLEVVGEAADGPGAVAVIRQTQPDVAVLDMRLPGKSGIEVTREVTAEQPDVRVLILSAYDDEDYVAAAVQAGALGYVLKTATERELAEAVAEVAAGRPVVAPVIAQKLARLWGRAPAAPRGPLTPRELEVLELVTRGLRNKEIGQELGLSPRTVEVHLKNVYEKLGVTSRTQAVAYASSHHLFGDEVQAADAARLPT